MPPEQRLREAALAPFRDLGGTVGVAVRDLGTGRTVLLNERRPFPAASLYKLPVMVEAFRRRAAGELTFEDELTIGPADAAEDLGTLIWPVGTRLSLGTALERMITISDNSSAVMLLRVLGSAQVNETTRRLGLEQTAILRDGLSTSPLDMLRLLEVLASGRAAHGPTGAEMVGLLARQQVRDRIPALLPPAATVANKTGDWEGAAHDVALVYGPRATLAVAFLSEGVGDREAAYAAMARAARALYDVADDPTFGSRPDPPLPAWTSGSYAAPGRPPLPAAPTRVPAPAAPAEDGGAAGPTASPEPPDEPDRGRRPAGRATATPAPPKPTRTPTSAAAGERRGPTAGPRR